MNVVKIKDKKQSNAPNFGIPNLPRNFYPPDDDNFFPTPHWHVPLLLRSSGFQNVRPLMRSSDDYDLGEIDLVETNTMISILSDSDELDSEYQHIRSRYNRRSNAPDIVDLTTDDIADDHTQNHSIMLSSTR